MRSRTELRASNADRATAAERLRVAVDEGRLELNEYDERLRRAYEAKTYGELDVVLADLPGTAPREMDVEEVNSRSRRGRCCW